MTRAPSRGGRWRLAGALALALFSGVARAQDYVADVEFALAAIEREAGDLIRQKDIDWKQVAREFRKQAKEVASPVEHRGLLLHLIARLQDGHAEVRPLEAAGDVGWPAEYARETTGAGMFWCVVDGGVYVKNVWNDAQAAGLAAGSEILSVDGVKAAKWLEARVAQQRALHSFSSDQQALFYTCHWGLAEPPGTRMKLEVREDKKKKKKTLTYDRSSCVPWGPAFFPEGVEEVGDLRVGRTAAGFGYVHVRRCHGELPTLMDEALVKVGDVPGLVLDFRANGGGGFDHDAFMGRFVPAGKRLQFGKTYESAGPNPYGGPIVVIVDGNTRSAGETGAAIFKEDGRAYVIGESPTAGMSSRKTTIDLPSGLFQLYVSTGSNLRRANGGRGLEGIGLLPHAIVPYDPEDMAAGRDTLILRAEALLADYPKKAVPYDPADFGAGE